MFWYSYISYKGKMKITGVLKSLPGLGKIMTYIIFQIQKYRYYLKNRKVLQRNIEWKDKYIGQSCYILGNGPSLKGQDVSLLEGKIVFTVNNLMMTKEFETIKPSFHLMADPLNFSSEDTNSQTLIDERFSVLRSSKFEPTCIFPLKVKPLVEEEDLYPDKKIIYFMNYGNWRNGEIRDINLQKFLPEYVNIIHIAIMVAMYMGFKKIYLMGVDMTSFLVNYEYKDEGGFNQQYAHFYKEEERMKKLLLKAWSKSNNEIALKNMAQCFEIFRFLKTYGKRNGVEIVNLTKGGALDVFERRKFEEEISKI
ncbi:MAG: hypothetical protein UR73_C0007G0020 [candidate division WS6 bacterium GW2011_GWF1_35_23]|uniref:6-hydroxymethylpterin diphosphokinase MptE-like domain-containing protein n=1 Tax=candidate division WS6 bacterium GW2011_GWF1_35_23 TaxID=1619097 RepID=A0A0G0ES28_9BACT|nr:MAG: hypothetical protein UR73_C0007G0020 [candidate division WS6 bacterium GW2011_GWF1_35_23]